MYRAKKPVRQPPDRHPEYGGLCRNRTHAGGFFGKANYLDKARQQPDKVKQVQAKVKTDGLAQTVDAVRSKLDQPLPLGYCNAGVVLESGVEGIEPGDRMVSNGNHAEMVLNQLGLSAQKPLWRAYQQSPERVASSRSHRRSEPWDS